MASSSNVLCGPCETQNITKPADHWCPECEEGLCNDCQKHHSASKGTRSHGVISVENYQKLPTTISEVVHHCQDHNMRHQMYCSHHDQICCPVCVSTNHQNCTGLKAISELIKTSKTSTLLANMEQSLHDIKHNIDQVIRNRKDNLSTIGIQRDKFIDDIKQKRIKINSHLDRLEQKITNELLSAEKEAKAKIEKMLTKINKTENEVDDLQNTLMAVKEYASDLQTFFGSKAMEAEVEKIEKYMKSLQEDEGLQELNLKLDIDEKASNMMSYLTTFGTVSVVASVSSVVMKSEREKQAQIMTVIQQPSPKTINNIKVSLVSKFNHSKKNCDVHGCVVLPNGRIVLADCNRSRGLLILNSDGSIDREIDLKGSYELFDVTAIHDTLLVVSTCSGIQFIDLDSGTIVKTIKTGNIHHGITNHNNKVLWCEQSVGIRMAGLSDNRISTVVKDKTIANWAYIAACGDNIYTTNYKTKTVTCYQDNKKLWDFTDLSMFRDPEGVTVDNHRNVFITSFIDSKVVIISPDGTQGRIILIKADDIKEPWGIYFDKTRNILIVVNKDGTVFRYSVSYT